MDDRYEARNIIDQQLELLAEARDQGTVLLRVVVTADGRVGDLEIFRSPYRGESLAQAAVDAVRQWRYVPATQGGRPVDVYFTVRVDFDLQ